jgi:hypothetical protein
MTCIALYFDLKSSRESNRILSRQSDFRTTEAQSDIFFGLIESIQKMPDLGSTRFDAMSATVSLAFIWTSL